MNPRSTSLLLAGCLFALPALLPGQAAPAPSPDPTAQLRAAVEKLRAADLTPAERARLKRTLEALKDKLEAVHADEAPEHARSPYEVIDRGRKTEAKEEAARAHSQERTPEDPSAHYERALRAYSGAMDKAAAAEKAMVERKSELDHTDYLVKQLRSLHEAESDAGRGQDQAAAERVRELVRARDAGRAAQQPAPAARRMSAPAQDPEIRELIAQVRRQLAEVRRLMDQIRRRMDAPQAARGRAALRATTPAPAALPPSSGNPDQPPSGMPGAPVPPNAPRARRRGGADAELPPEPPDAPTPPPVQPRRRTAAALPGMSGGGAWPQLPAVPQAPGAGTPPTPAPPQPGQAPVGFPQAGMGSVSTPLPSR